MICRKVIQNYEALCQKQCFDSASNMRLPPESRIISFSGHIVNSRDTTPNTLKMFTILPTLQIIPDKSDNVLLIGKNCIFFALKFSLIMAIAINNIPTLQNDDAKAFIKKADAKSKKRATVDFTKQLAASRVILEKAKMH